MWCPLSVSSPTSSWSLESPRDLPISCYPGWSGIWLKFWAQWLQEPILAIKTNREQLFILPTFIHLFNITIWPKNNWLLKPDGSRSLSCHTFFAPVGRQKCDKRHPVSHSNICWDFPHFPMGSGWSALCQFEKDKNYNRDGQQSYHKITVIIKVNISLNTD